MEEIQSGVDRQAFCSIQPGGLKRGREMQKYRKDIEANKDRHKQMKEEVKKGLKESGGKEEKLKEKREKDRKREMF